MPVKTKPDNPNLIQHGARSFTVTEIVAALIHAEAFIRLANSVDGERFGPAAAEWLDKYGTDD